MKTLLHDIDIDDAIRIVMLAHDGPVFAYLILRILMDDGFNSTSTNLRGLIFNHLRKMEKQDIVKRHQMGWELTRKGKR